MILALESLAILAAAGAGVAWTARLLHRPLPRLYLGLFLLLAILPFGRAFVSTLTPLPLDHVSFIQPWARAGATFPYNPNMNDIATQILPWVKATRMAWKEGSLPLWNRWNGCGTPLAANSQSCAFSPWTFIGFALPLSDALVMLASLKLLIALSGMWLWARELGVSERSSCFASIAFAFSFTMTPWIFYPQSDVICLWPWILFFLELCRQGGQGPRPVLALTAGLALAALSGHPESVVVGACFGALWFLASSLASGGIRAAPLLRGSAAAVGAMAATAFLLLPTLFAIAASNRFAIVTRPYWIETLSAVPHWPDGGSLLLGGLLPEAFGDAIRSPEIVSLRYGSFPERTPGYFGLVGWTLALMILRPGSRRRRIEWVLVALMVTGAAMGIGQWPLAEIAAAIPGIRHIFPLRFLAWLALAGAPLAALELDRMARDWTASTRTRWAAVLVPLALGLLAAALLLRLRGVHAALGGLHFQNRYLLAVLALLAAAALLPLLVKSRPSLYVAGMTLLCAAELLVQMRHLYRLHPKSLFYPQTPLIRFLGNQPAPFRVASEDGFLFPNTNMFAGLESVGTHDAIERRDYVEFLDATCGYTPSDYFKQLRDLDAPALDFLNVRYRLASAGRPDAGGRWKTVYAGSDGTVLENLHVLPRAFAPKTIRLVPAAGGGGEGPTSNANALFGAAFRQIVAERDWSETAWILGEQAQEIDNGQAQLLDWSASTNTARMTVRVADRPAWLVMSIVQDGGWLARDEDTSQPLRLRRANGPFLALTLPAGVHRVRLDYSPPGFRLGAAISLSTMALLVIAAVARIAARRRPAHRGKADTG